MMYRPGPEFRLWDTWIFPAEGEFHLFHLQNPVGHSWDSLGHAVSTDLVHWEKRESIPMRGPYGAWDSGTLLTGMIIRHNDGYVMTYGSDVNGIQRIGIMFSSDLYHWNKYPGNPVLVPCAPYLHNSDWRDAYLMKVDNHYESLICARTFDRESCIARMMSRDLVNWEPLPPIVISPVSQCEVPEYFNLGDRHYLIFSMNDKSRKQSIGTRYLVSNNRLGGYIMLEDNLLLGSGNGRCDCYVGRTIKAYGERMFYYHNCGPRPSLGAPKVIRQFSDGRLWTEYWPSLAGLETKVLHIGISMNDILGFPRLWKIDGNRLIGISENQFSLVLLNQIVDDFHLTCNLNIEKGNCASVIFRYDEASKSGIAVVIDAKEGKIEMGYVDRIGFVARDTYLTEIQNEKDYSVRIFARSEFVDCYINNRFLFSTLFDDKPLSGKIGFAVNGALVSFGDLRVATLEHE